MQCVIHSNSNGEAKNISNIPWLLIEHQSKDAKKVIEKIKFPTGFCFKHEEYPNKERLIRWGKNS